MKIAVLDKNCRIIYKETVSTRAYSNKEKLISKITGVVNDTLNKSGIKRKDVIGVGIGVPGPVDFLYGVVHFFPNIPGWKNVKLKSLLKNKIKLPVFIDNDAKLMSIAEYKFGAARKFDNVACLTLGTGVGGGLILGGRLYRGAKNLSGEIGHIPISEKGPLCNCGGRGCLEAYIGNDKIARQAKREFKRNIKLEELSKLASKNNKKAVKIWRQVGEHLGTALSGVINLLNLDAVVIGGGVAEAGSILFKAVSKKVRKQAMEVHAKHAKIFKATLGVNAGLIGAALLVKERLRL